MLYNYVFAQILFFGSHRASEAEVGKWADTDRWFFKNVCARQRREEEWSQENLSGSNSSSSLLHTDWHWKTQAKNRENTINITYNNKNTYIHLHTYKSLMISLHFFDTFLQEFIHIYMLTTSIIMPSPQKKCRWKNHLLRNKSWIDLLFLFATKTIENALGMKEKVLLLLMKKKLALHNPDLLFTNCLWKMDPYYLVT